MCLLEQNFQNKKPRSGCLFDRYWLQ